MRFRDITTDTTSHYWLEQKEHAVFFMFNRFGTITFELGCPGAKATILSLVLTTTGENTLELIQRHQAPETTSRFVGKSLLGGDVRVTIDGQIVIEDKAVRSDSSQEFRTLLLSKTARVMVRPTLEIGTDDVRASHAATTSTLNDRSLFFSATRGLDEKTAKRLLLSGFINDLFHRTPLSPADHKRVMTATEREIQKLHLA